MQADYIPFVDRMIQKYEGPYGWNKKDPGGPTNFGITCFDLAEFEHDKMNSMAEWAPRVQAMSKTVAEQIYATKYATAINFNSLPAGVDVVVMDYAVNSGIGRGAMILREFPTIINKDPVTAINAICDERLRFLHGLGTWPEFGKGWNARVVDLRAYALHLAAGSTHETAPAAPDLSMVATPKGIHVGTKATTPTAGGVIAAGVAAHQGGLPIWGVALACAGVLGAGIAYEVMSEANAAHANLQVA